MTRPLPILVALLVLWSVALADLRPAAAQQQMRCAPRAQMLDILETRRGESRRAIGLTSGDTVMELYAAEETGSWTVVVTLPSGLSCLVATGTAFEGDPLLAPVRGTPA